MDRKFVCQYCNTGYSKEKTLAVHMCEQKRRALQKDEKHVQLGYYAFTRFYQLCQNIKGTKSYDEFCKSQYYNAFVKFGSFVSNVRPLYPEKYIDYVVTSGVKLDHWCRDELYDKYLADLVKVEPVESAVQRSLQYMMEWADEESADFTHYFKYVNVNRAVHHIRDGKISPWVVMNCPTGVEMLKSFNDEQLDMVNQILDFGFWVKKFKNDPGEVLFVKEVLKEAGIA